MKKWMKRLISLMLCLVMLLGTSMLNIQAETNNEITVAELNAATDFGEARVHVNPLYEDLIPEPELNAGEEESREHEQSVKDADKSLEYCDSYAQALYSAAKQMSDRDGICYIMFRDTGDFYYNMLYGKDNDALFAVTVSAIDACMQHTGDPDLGDALRWQYKTYSYYKPTYQYSNGYYYYTMKFQPIYYTTAAQERAVDQAVDALLEELDVYSGTEYDKVEAVYDWICENVEYDYAGLAANDLLRCTAYAAIVNKTAVCQGYAVLMYRLLLELGVDNRVVTSYDHAWNIVEKIGRAHV